MGLFQRMSDSGIKTETKVNAAAEQKPVQKKSNSVGLLKKSMILSNDDGLDFFEFLRANNIKIASLLKLSDDGSYIATKCIGLDAHSICMSVSTNDFWNGIIKNKEELYSFKEKDSEILPFYQFFSKKIKDKIKCVNLIQKEDGTIFLFCTPVLTSEEHFKLTEQLKKIKFTSSLKFANSNSESDASDNKSTIFEIELSEAVDSFIFSNYKSQYSENLKNTILDSISYELLQNFTKPSAVYRENESTFKIEYLSQEEIPFEVLSNHLRLNCSFYLDEHSQLLSITKI